MNAGIRHAPDRAKLREDFMKRLWSALLATLAVACSGADGTGLLGDSGSQPQEGDAAAVGPDASVEDATTPLDSQATDVVVHEEATVDAPVDTYVGPADSKIQCGQGACSAQNEICCWHQGSTTKQFECMSDASACGGTYDVQVTCSSRDNCASQGHASFQCCATGGNPGWGTCSSYDIASTVACKPSCGSTDYEIGCSLQKQNCTDSLQTCVTSKCTYPGATMCY